MPVWEIITGCVVEGVEMNLRRAGCFSVAADAPLIKTVGVFTRSGATNDFSGRLFVIFSFF